MIEVLIEALIDSSKVFALVFVIFLLIAFFKNKIRLKFVKNNKMAPLYASVIGIIPQCGVSVLGSELYVKKHISLGTLIALFISCSDEAIPMFLSHKDMGWTLVTLILAKIVIASIFGIIIDLLNKPQDIIPVLDVSNIKDNEDSKHLALKQYFIHPLGHAFEIFLYVLGISLIFGILIYYVGEDNIVIFLQQNKYLSPFLCVIVGIIPNCSASIILSQMYFMSGISFGACLAGLCVNSGLGIIYLFKNLQSFKSGLKILLILIAISLFVGYFVCLIFGF